MGKLTREDVIAMGLIQPEIESDENHTKREDIERRMHEKVAELEAYLRGDGLTRAIICDLDGTLALMQGRGPFEWHRVGEDALNKPVAELLHRYQDDHAILIVSGRSEECRVDTVRWLKKHDIPCLCLFMRKAGDYRKDAQVKLEIFHESIAGRYQVVLCLDDRNQSVEFWRSLGLTCFQVAPGDF